MRYALVFLLVLTCACSPKKKDEEASAANAAANAAAEEDRLTREFIVRFCDAIDANDVNRWPEVLSRERVARFQQEGVMDKVYAAWQRGTATVSKRIREAPYRLEKTADKMILHFEGVIVANDPETGYSMTVRIEDGRMVLDEN